LTAAQTTRKPVGTDHARGASAARSSGGSSSPANDQGASASTITGR
jgi:hypothetical protein